MKPFTPELPDEAQARIARLERQLARERKAREAAEAIAEKGLRELYDSQQRLSLIQRITEAANSAKDVRIALSVAVREVCCQMGWDFGNALLVDPATGEARACDCWYAASPQRLADFVEASRRIAFPPNIGLPGRVVSSAQPLWIDDTRIDDNFLRREAARECHIIAGCALPVMVGRDVVAVIEFFSRSALQPSDELVSTLRQIAVQLGRVVERDRARAALLHDALHDALTGLPNRVLLKERSQAAFERLPADRQGLSMLVIDLDGFKLINDRYGHHAGDGVLVEVTRRFVDALEQARQAQKAEHQGWHVTLARTGGDEFVALVDGLYDDETPQRLAHALHGVLASPLVVEGDHFSVGASIGIGSSGPDYKDVDQILRDADLAMYQAKANGRGGTVVFSAALGARFRNRVALEREILDAIRQQQFVLHYQPIRLLGSGETLGFEALVRWNHPTRGLLDPGQFIPMAEETGLIVFIGDWVLREACSAMARFYATHPHNMRPFVTVNVAPQQFLQPNFAEMLRDVLMETAVPPETIRLEVTEGVAVIDAERTGRVLAQLREWGVKTILDDFGTGYSSLSYLNNLPFDSLKIDRSFIASLDKEKSRNIVRTILELARNLDLTVVAEGIENESQQRVLQEMGCVKGQGYLLGRPVGEQAAFDQFMARQR
jgi:diguanylate cyclase (GGDEF)-like protein